MSSSEDLKQIEETAHHRHRIRILTDQYFLTIIRSSTKARIYDKTVFGYYRNLSLQYTPLIQNLAGSGPENYSDIGKLSYVALTAKDSTRTIFSPGTKLVTTKGANDPFIWLLDSIILLAPHRAFLDLHAKRKPCSCEP